MSETLPAEIIEKQEVAKNVFGFKLKALSPAPNAEPGSHIDLHFGDFIRQYSLISSTTRPNVEYHIAVLREEGGRGGSKMFCDNYNIGDTLRISVPRNNFQLDLKKERYVLLGGGIGITPLLFMAKSLQLNDKPFEFRICTKTPEHIPFRRQISEQNYAPKVSYHHSDGPSKNPIDLKQYLNGLASNVQVYACGPARFLDAIDEITQNWEPWRVRVERFSNQVESLSETDGGAFNVHFKSSGLEVEVPADKSLLDIMNENGVSMASSCLEGVCGTCITPVISGDIIHRDACLYDEEKTANTAIAPCVSRAAPGTILVLDI